MSVTRLSALLVTFRQYHRRYVLRTLTQAGRQERVAVRSAEDPCDTLRYRFDCSIVVFRSPVNIPKVIGPPLAANVNLLTLVFRLLGERFKLLHLLQASLNTARISYKVLFTETVPGKVLLYTA